MTQLFLNILVQTCFAHDGKILDALEKDCEEERNDCQEVNEVHSTETHHQQRVVKIRFSLALPLPLPTGWLQVDFNKKISLARRVPDLSQLMAILKKNLIFFGLQVSLMKYSMAK